MKRFSLFALVLTLIFSLTACSGGDASSAQSGGAGESGASQAGESEPVKLKWALWDWDAVTYYKPLLEAYKEKNPNVEIEWIDLGYTDYPTAIATQLAGDSSIDIVTIGNIPTYVNLSKIGHLEKLDSYIDSSKMDLSVFKGVADSLKFNDSLYALPFRNDFWVTYYNKDLFDAAGVEYPTNDMSVKEYLELAAKVTSGEGNEKVYGAHFHTWNSTVQYFGILDGKHTVLDGKYDFFKPYYEMALKAQDDGIVRDYGTLKANNTHYSGLFYDNKLAMVHMGIWWAPTIIDKLESGEAQCKNWGIVKYPHPDGVEAGTTLSTITCIGVSSHSAKKEAAWDFVRFVAGEEGAKVVAKSGSVPAAQSGDVMDIIFAQKGFPQDENSREALNTTKTYLEMPVSEHAAEIDQILATAHDSIMTKNISIDDGIKQMNEKAAALGIS